MRVLALALCLAASSVETAFARPQTPAVDTARTPAGSHRGALLGGVAAGFALHEAGHVAAGWRRTGLAPLRGFVVTSAGFWVQFADSEIVLTRHPSIRFEPKPFGKGLLGFHIAVSAGYAMLGMSKAGPPGRDTLGMANTSQLNERWIGAMLLAPAIFDAVRYAWPRLAWPKWASRAAKVSIAAMVMKARE
jgi:hypothetical protein